jgi:hypothetical protein
MAAAWATPQLRTASSRIKMLATNTAKGGFFTGVFEERVVTAVIIKPEAEE